jgi:POT family proton-dependent oligopeptide transporter
MSQSNTMPSGIPYIVGNETAERFSYYGMKAILTIFMVNYLHMSEHDAIHWMHTFGSAVYFMPIFGALIADVFLGKYKTILSLSIVYCIGHLILALNETQQGLYWGLTFIAIGSGGIKPCVSAHVGDQFNKNNSHLVEKIFGYFYVAINMGAFVSSMATPLLLKYYGPSIAFGIPGLLMLLATYIFWLGRKSFVHIPPFGKEYLKLLTSKEGLSAIGRLMFIYLFIAVFWALYDQNGSTWILQANNGYMNKEVDLYFFSFEILPDQIQTINPFLILFFVPLFSHVLYPWIDRIIPLSPLKKIFIGMLIATIPYILLGMVEDWMFKGQTVSVHWHFLAYLFLTIAEILISVTALEFSYTQAPNAIKSSIMGLYLFSVSLGNVFVTIINDVNAQETAIQLQSNNHYLTVSSNEVLIQGEKLELPEDKKIFVINALNDTSYVGGTYYIGQPLQKNTYQILDNQGTRLQLIAPDKLPQGVITGHTHLLKGGNYFYFYAAVMLLTAILFSYIAFHYKGKTYIQDHPLG